MYKPGPLLKQYWSGRYLFNRDIDTYPAGTRRYKNDVAMMSLYCLDVETTSK